MKAKFAAVNEVADAKAARMRRQAFYTPLPLVEKLVEWADVSEHTRCLEPSAGDGRIVHALRSAGVAIIDACEIETAMHGRITDAGGSVVGTDFLKYQPGTIYDRLLENRVGVMYDRIVMNPPFKGKTWRAHVEHAWGMLADGGRLLSLAPSDGGKVLADGGLDLPGCNWATWEPLDPGLFKEFETGIQVGVIELARETDHECEGFSNVATCNAALTIDTDNTLRAFWVEHGALLAGDPDSTLCDGHPDRFQQAKSAALRAICESGGSCYGIVWWEVGEYFRPQSREGNRGNGSNLFAGVPTP